LRIPNEEDREFTLEIIARKRAGQHPIDSFLQMFFERGGWDWVMGSVGAPGMREIEPFGGKGPLMGGRRAFSVRGRRPTYVPRRMSVREALEHGLTERDPQWPWRGLHETEDHHPLMQGSAFRKYWQDRGFSNAEVEEFTKTIDKDLHRAITESGWWDAQLLGQIAEAEAGGTKLTKEQVRVIVNKLLRTLKDMEDAMNKR
jgi:hypothetical protein